MYNKNRKNRKNNKKSKKESNKFKRAKKLLEKAANFAKIAKVARILSAMFSILVDINRKYSKNKITSLAKQNSHEERRPIKALEKSANLANIAKVTRMFSVM